METWREPARDVPIVGRPDVLVVGAGSAGIAAAIASARQGAQTWLVERSSFLGGLATVGLINLLLTLDDGAGHQVVAGLCQEFVDRLAALDRCRFPPASEWNSDDAARVDEWRRWGLVWGAPESVRYSVAFDPEAFVDVAIDALRAAGVRLRLHTWFAGVGLTGGAVDAVLVESKKGREAILPRVVVDTSGDGDVFVAAGAEHEHMTIPPHLWFRAGGVTGRAGPFVFDTVDAGRVLVPWGPHPDRVDPCDPDDMTRAELVCRDEARAAFTGLRSSDPAFANVWLDDYARHARDHREPAARRRPRAREGRRRRAVSRHDRAHRALDEARRRLQRSVPVPDDTRGREPARRRPVHLRHAVRPPGHEGDPGRDGHRRGGRRRRRDGRGRGSGVRELDVAALRSTLRTAGADVGT